LVFAVVLVTVLLNATTARFFAKVVGVFLKSSEGMMIIGASKVSRLIGTYLQKNNRHVVLVDSNRLNIDKAKELGLDAVNANIYADDLTDNIEFSDVGYLIALTGNDEINKHAITRFEKIFGENGSYRLMNTAEISNPNKPTNTTELFSTTHDYIKFTEVARKYPSIQEIKVDSKNQFLRILNIIEDDDDAIALFLKTPKGDIKLIHKPTEMEVDEKSEVAYLGKPMDFEDVANATRDENEGTV